MCPLVIYPVAVVRRRRLAVGMSRTPLPADWSTPEYADLARDWCATVTGPVRTMTQHKLRPWATVWRVEAAEGVFFFKQNCPGQAFEAAAMRVLAELSPRHIVPVTAVDAERAFLLTPDQGPVFADTAGDDLDAWCRLVATSATLQHEVAGSVDRLIAAGMTAMPASDAAAYVEQQIDRFASLPDGHPSQLPGDQTAALAAHLPVVQRWAEEVAGLGLPLTLHHNDLHEHNAFDIDGELRFFDFADAVLTEPLAELLIPLNVLFNKLECDAGDPRLEKVAGAFLEVWSDVAPAADLRAVLPAALRLACLGRVESWRRCLGTFTDTELSEYGAGPASWLFSLLEDPPIS